MVGFLAGYTGENLIVDQEKHKCMVSKVNKKIFGDNFNAIMTYMDENKQNLNYDSRTIALKIN